MLSKLKNGTSKTYLKVQYLIYTETIKKMHKSFLESKKRLQGSCPALFRCKPFYIIH